MLEDLVLPGCVMVLLVGSRRSIKLVRFSLPSIISDDENFTFLVGRQSLMWSTQHTVELREPWVVPYLFIIIYVREGFRGVVGDFVFTD